MIGSRDVQSQRSSPRVTRHSIRSFASVRVKLFHGDVIVSWPITAHLRAACFPPSSLYLLHSFAPSIKGTLYPVTLHTIEPSASILGFYYEIIISTCIFLCLCSSKAEGRKGARHFVPVISNISKQQVGMMLSDTIMYIGCMMICSVLETMDDGDVWGILYWLPVL